MVQRTIIHRAGPAVRAEMLRFESAFPLTFFALALGFASGVALAGVVVPAVVQNVMSTVVRIVTGA